MISRLKTLSWAKEHPLLGGRQALVYKIQYFPLAPHTLPSDADLTIDRRLLPGDDLDAATDEIRTAIGDLGSVRGDCAARRVHAAGAGGGGAAVGGATRGACGDGGPEAESSYRRSTFDAGGPAPRVCRQ